jgi:hypothetical protein
MRVDRGGRGHALADVVVEALAVQILQGCTEGFDVIAKQPCRVATLLFDKQRFKAIPKLLGWYFPAM